MAIHFYSSIDLNTNELQGAVIENTTEPGSPVEGQIYYDTTADTIYFRNASAWVDMGAGASGDITAVTSILHSSFTDIGTAADQEYIKFDTANEINIMINNTERLSVTASGVDITGTLGTSGAATLASLVCTAGATFGGGTGSSGVTISTAGAITADAIIKTESTTDATSTTDGSLQTDGGLSVAKDVIAGNDIYLLTDSSVLGLGAGKDFTITHDGTTGATIAGNPVNITAGGASTWKSSAGAITIDAEAHKVEIDGHSGINISSSNSGQVDITSAADIDINATTGIAADGTTVSIDGTDDSNLTVTGSGKDLDIAVAGGSTQELRLTSAGTGASAMHLNASAGGINIDSADMIDIDAADEITITTTSADGHISLVSAHTAGDAVHIDANANAGSIVNIDAGILDIDADDVVTIDAADEIEITTTSADGHISLVSAHTAGQAIHLDGDANAGSIVDIDAGILDIDVTGESTLDTTLLTLTGVGGLKILDTTTSSATEGGSLILANDDGAVMADNHRLGVIEFKGAEDTSNTLTTGARIQAIADATWSASENGASLEFYTTDANASEGVALTLDSDQKATFAAAVHVAGNLTVAGTTTTQNTVLVENTVTTLVFEGATADAHETTLKVVEPTADCTFSLPTLTAGNFFLPAIADTATDASAAVTAAEFALLDGGSTVGTTAVANGDGIVTNDAGTMKHTTVQTFQTYFDANSVGGSSIVTTGALDTGSITSGFGAIDNGSSNITTTGAISGGTIDASTDFTIGTTVITDDSIVMTPSSSDTVTIAAATHGILSITTVDAAGTAGDIVITADGQIGYQANDAAGHIFNIAGADQLTIVDGAMKPSTDSDVDLGSESLYWKDAYIDSVTTTGNVTIGGDIDLEGDMDINGTLETDALTIAGTAIVAQSTASAVGGVELATADEVKTGTDTARVVTADTFSAKSVVAIIAVGSLSTNKICTVTHGLGTADVVVQLYDMTTEAIIHADVARTALDMSTASTSVVSVDFGTAPPNDVRCVITSLAGATVNDATTGTDVNYS